jgi:hypothetical protein
MAKRAAIAGMAKAAIVFGSWLWVLGAMGCFIVDSALAATSIDVASYFPLTPGSMWRHKVNLRTVTRSMGAPIRFQGATVQTVLDKPGYAGNPAGDKTYISFCAQGLRRHGTQTQVSVRGLGLLAASEVDMPPILYLARKAIPGAPIARGNIAMKNFVPRVSEVGAMAAKEATWIKVVGPLSEQAGGAESFCSVS